LSLKCFVKRAIFPIHTRITMQGPVSSAAEIVTACVVHLKLLLTRLLKVNR
jgi:hypothetical protein